MIYFIQRGDKDGPIKIGVSSDPVERLRSLQTASAEKLTLLGFIPGRRTEERAMHRRFAAGRLEGEWFRRDTPGLSDVLSGVGHGEFLIWSLGEADEQIKTWQRRRDEIVEEILTYCARCCGGSDPIPELYEDVAA